MDINLPQMNGIDVTRIIKTLRQYLPIVAISACQVDKINRLIFDDYIMKPASQDQIINALTRFLC